MCDLGSKTDVDIRLSREAKNLGTYVSEMVETFCVNLFLTPSCLCLC